MQILQSLKDRFRGKENKNPKTIFITGCSSGIGRAAAFYFAAQGWRVAATMRNTAKAGDLQQQDNIKIYSLDVTDAKQARKAAAQAIADFGHVDVLLNNAGSCFFGALEHATTITIDDQFAVNVKGVIHCIQAFLPYFKQAGGGKIITVSSMAGLSSSMPLASLYTMSKFAVEGLMEGLYYELKPLNINLHLVEPGSFNTAIGSNTHFNYNPDVSGYADLFKKVKAIFEYQENHSKGDPQQVAEAIFELATGKSQLFRTLLGNDAEQIMGRRASQPIEVFLAQMEKQFH